MAKQVVTRTYSASIRNQSRVSNDLDALGFAASKLWNVGRWTCSRIWDEIGHIPNHNELTTYLKNHERYDDLHSQSSQRVLQELAEAFNSWYGKRRNGDTRANPPGYRKHGDDHPRSTVTFKAAGFQTRHPVQSRPTLERLQSESVLVGLHPSVSTRCGPMLTSPVWRTSGKSGPSGLARVGVALRV